MRFVFLDAGYVVAVDVENDQHHIAAKEHWRATMPDASLRLVTTTFVFDEVVTFLNSKGQHARAVELGNDLLKSPSIQLVDVDRPLFDAGWAFFQQHCNKTYSLTDCISFVVMQRLGIRTTFTFDHHFRQAGFEVEP